MPATEARPVTDGLHGVSSTDPYRWLEEQDSPDTRAWIRHQNAYTDTILANRPEKQRFADRLYALQNTDQISIPRLRGKRAFYTRRRAGEELYSIYMREGDGAEQLLIDPIPLSADKTVSVGINDVSDDGRLLAYYVRKGGADEVEIHFFDVDGRAGSGQILPRSRFSGVAVTPDNRTAYYTRLTAEGPRVFRRAISGGSEEKLFGDGYGREKIISTSLSDDGQHLLLHVLHGSAASKVEIYTKDLRADGPIRTIVNDVTARSSASIVDGKVVIRTNWNAPNEKVMIADLANPQPANWRELIAESKTAAIQDISLAGGRLFVRTLENVKPRIAAYDLDGRSRGEIAFDTIGSLEDISGSWSSPAAFFRFSSFHIPPTIYRYDVASGERTVFATVNAPVDPNQFLVEQVWYPSKDGTRIPMFLMYKKGLIRDGRRPAYLTGYGGFTVSQLPSFTARAIAWCEQGGVYALPNLRGGGEFGETWHRAGMLDKKQNTYDDFIAAGEYLIREQYTSPQRLSISGRSNGGLLVMAVATQRPDLVGAVICGYPLIDMYRYQKFLVGSFWVPEYGDPDVPEEYRYIYSPYHQVKPGTAYPAIYFYTGDSDTRVAPLHARKMVARMQAANAGPRPIVLRYQESGGHSAGAPLRVEVQEEAERLAFLWWQLTGGTLAPSNLQRGR
jgi:prolyl oligopeptidase